MRPDLFLATIGRGSNGSNALEVTEERAAVTAESQDNIINRVNNVSQYGPSWHYVPGIGLAGTAYAEVPGSALGDLAFSRASSKTRTNSAGVVETIAANVPPHDYRNADGTLSTFPRLNLEPQRTNLIRNSSMVGAVAGTPGTLPTNWISPLSALTRTIVGIGTENGLPYIDLRFQGTASGTASSFLFETSTAIAALTGQTWSLTFYAKVINGTVPTTNMYVVERTSGGSYVIDSATTRTLTSNLERLTFTRTLSGGATVGAVQPGFYFLVTIGESYDFTVRIAAPQMELGAYATTWVPTTTAAVTRLADTASKTGVSSLIGQTEGTLFVEANVSQLQGAVARTFIDIGSTNNRVFVGFTSLASNTMRLQIETALGTRVDFRAVVSSPGTIKVAAAYKDGDCALYVNGVAGTLVANNSISFTTISNLFLGQTIVSSAILADGIAQAALFPTRLTNDQLAELTTL